MLRCVIGRSAVRCDYRFGAHKSLCASARKTGKTDKEGNVVKVGKVTRKEKTTTEAFLEYVHSWGLPDAFSKANVDIFLDNYPMAYNEIFVHYTKSLLGSRVKN